MAIWVEDNVVKFQFYEKPTCPNRVLQRESALSDECLRASLMQEVVRRLLLCSTSLSMGEVQSILLNFAQKMVNSNHSVESTRIILVHGVTKYLKMLKLCKLSPEDPNYRPLHFGKHDRSYARRLKKFMSK